MADHDDQPPTTDTMPVVVREPGTDVRTDADEPRQAAPIVEMDNLEEPGYGHGV